MELKLFSATGNKAQAVWLLDDDSSGLKSLSRLLDSSGWNVKSFTDPFAFLQQAGIDCPNVAVIDIVMPKLDGIEAARQMRRERPDAKIIVMSGGPRAGKADLPTTARELGAAAALEKPFDPEELTTLLRALIAS